MATELVVLSDIPFTEELVLATALQVIPDGAGVSFRDGEITQFLDMNADPVLTMFDTTVVHDPADARALLNDPPVSFALWTEFILPFTGSTAGRPLIDALARAVQGTVREKL